MAIKKLQNNFTTPEQSKRLLELGVPADSADCWYNSTKEHGIVTWFHMGIRYCIQDFPDFPDWSKTWKHGGFFGKKVPYYLPCWSVGRLNEIFKICSDNHIEIYDLDLKGTQIERAMQAFENYAKYNWLYFSKLED